MKALSICFVCDEYPPGPHGGIGTFVQMLARALVNAGHEAKVVGMYPHDYPADDYQQDQGVEVWRFRRPTHRLGWLRGRYAVYKKVSKLTRAGEIDLIEVVDYGGPAAIWPQLNVPVIARLHGSASYFAAEMNTQVPRNFFRLEEASLQRADFLCSVSKYTAEKTQQAFAMKDQPDAILYNFIDSTSSESWHTRTNQDVIYSGTLTYKKGVVPLIQAWPQVLAKQPNAKLHVYGKDGQTIEGKSMQEMLFSQLNSDEQRTVKFHGHTDRQDLLNALREARVGVFPSYAESFGLAPAESMAAACPTIYSQRGCGGELVRDGQDGLLVDPDQPKQIADAILRILQDDRLAEELGTAGVRRIREKFSLEAVLPKNLAFYHDCIQRKSEANRSQ